MQCAADAAAAMPLCASKEERAKKLTDRIVAADCRLASAAAAAAASTVMCFCVCSRATEHTEAPRRRLAMPYLLD